MGPKFNLNWLIGPVTDIIRTALKLEVDDLPNKYDGIQTAWPTSLSP